MHLVSSYLQLSECIFIFSVNKFILYQITQHNSIEESNFHQPTYDKRKYGFQSPRSYVIEFIPNKGVKTREMECSTSLILLTISNVSQLFLTLSLSFI
jgi:hypothetical protein